MSTESTRVRVILISGAGRSGGTIIGNVLGEIPDVVSIGELYQIYNKQLIETELCGCGKQLKQCEFWKPIFEYALHGMDEDDFGRLRLLRDAMVRTRNSLLMGIPVYRNQITHQLQEYMDVQERLYQTIHANTGCRFIIDTSRIPSYGWLLTQMKSIDPFVIHLVRDSRAVAYSWLKRRTRPTTQGMVNGIQQKPIVSALVWCLQNIATETLTHHLTTKRSIRMNYEYITIHPQIALQKIADAACLTTSFTHDMIDTVSNSVHLGFHHTLAGNSSRFKTGLVRLNPDMEWKTAMPGRSKLIVSCTTLPLLRRYGYRFTDE